jgi:glycosyltransferase involved in cell wall biosynthesis
LRILFLTQTYPRDLHDTSGPFIRDLARGLVRLGDAVSVLTPHAEGVARAWDDDGVSVRSFRYAPVRAERLGYSRSLNADEVMRPAAAAVAPAYLLGAAIAVRRAAQSGFDVLHTHWIIPNGLLAIAAPRTLPVAIGLHGSDVFMAERPVIDVVARRALGRTDLLTGCSAVLVERVNALGFPAQRSRIIPYGVDAEMFSPSPDRRPLWRDRLGIPSSAPVILSVGRMVTKKGYAYLLDALPDLLTRHGDLHVIMAGDGDLLGDFKRRTAPWTSRVHLPGRVTRDVLPDLYRAADIFVLPAVHDSKGNVDGLPNVILEAMASGLPVVASSISGIPLAIHDRVHGLLVPEKSSAALGAALTELIANPAQARALGAASRMRAFTELTWDAVAARYRDAYDEMLVRRHSVSSR